VKKVIIFTFLLLAQVSSHAAERAETSSGTGTGSTETEACDAAMNQARDTAARRASEQVKPMLEKMLSTTNYFMDEDINSLAIRLTLQATRVFKKRLTPHPDKKTGTVTCDAMAVFAIDLSKAEEAFQAMIDEKKQTAQRAAEQRRQMEEQNKKIEEQKKKAAKAKEREEAKKQSQSNLIHLDLNPFPDE
jgi:dsDNA-specific endonuclease/ATPase MutS2